MKLTAVAFFAVLAFAAGQSLDDCLQQDSISCVQKSLYRRARAFFEQSTLEIVPGVNLVKSKDNERSARSGEQAVFDQQIETAANVVDRQSALEGFVGEEVDRFMAKRSLKINFAPMIEKVEKSARALADTVPQEMRQAVGDVFEGRGKKHKLTKLVAPILGLIKVKLAALAVFIIGLVAKKAIIASLISIAISGYLGMRSLFGGKSGASTTAYSSGWANPAPTYGAPAYGAPAAQQWDEHAAQNQAYAGYSRR